MSVALILAWRAKGRVVQSIWSLRQWEENTRTRHAIVTYFAAALPTSN